MVFTALLGFELPPLLIVALTLLVILVVRSWANSPVNLPPCPARPYPILGHLVHMSKDARRVMMDWSKQTGDIFTLYLGTTRVVVLSSYDIIKEALVKQADSTSDRPKEGLMPLLPRMNGIIETSGEIWKENRTTVLYLLRDFGMGKNLMAQKIEEEVQHYLEELEKLEDRPVDLKYLTLRAVSNVICSFLLGKRYDYDDAFYKRFLKMFEDSIEGTTAGALHLWFPKVKYIPGDPFKTKHFFDNEEREELLRNVQEDSGEFNRNNIIAHYLSELKTKREKGLPTHLSEEGIGRVISDLMTAGTETTATTIRWFYIYMIHNPDVQKNIHEELDEKIGSGRNPQITDRPKLVYLNAAIMETQRLASIIPFGLFHRCNEETTLRGYTIPKDTHIMTHLDSVLHSQEIWRDPQTFRPERFIGPKGNLLNPEEFAPFSIGRRLCLGEALAKAELFIFLAHVLQRYQICPERPGSPPSLDSVLGISLAPVPGNIKIVRRDRH